MRWVRIPAPVPKVPRAMWSKSVVVAERGPLVQVARVRPEVRVVDQPLAGETTERYRHEVEAHELHVEEQVGVGDGVADEEAPIGEAPVEVGRARRRRDH